MFSIKTIAIAGGTLVLAAGAGFYMQNGSRTAAPQHAALTAPAPVDPAPIAAEVMANGPGPRTPLTDTPTQMAVLTDLPKEVATPAAFPAEAVELAAISLTSAELTPGLPQTADIPATPTRVAATPDTLTNPKTVELSTPAAQQDCLVDLTGENRAAAMIALRLTAPCQPNARVTFQQGELTFSMATDANGLIEVDLPALSETALIIATLDDGNAAAVEMMVDTLAFYDRAAVQWQGIDGIGIHAREFGADYDSDGHVWSGAPRDATIAARGQGGFVTRLGDPELGNAAMAEVYTFPTGMTQSTGDIELTVEVQVTDLNCDRQVTASVIEISQGQAAPMSTLDMTLPACDAVGDYLLLKNLVDDLKIAAK